MSTPLGLWALKLNVHLNLEACNSSNGIYFTFFLKGGQTHDQLETSMSFIQYFQSLN